MRCKEYQMLIFNYIDGALGARQKASLDAHLEKCRDCRDYMAFERQMRRVFPEVLTERLNELTLAPEARRNVINAVQPAVEKKRWRWIGIRRPAWALAAGLMLAIIPASLYWMAAICQKPAAVGQSVALEPPSPAPEYITSNESEEGMDSYRTQKAFILKNQQAEYLYAIQKEYGADMYHETENSYWKSEDSGNAPDGIPDNDIDGRNDPGSAGLNNQFNREAFA